MVLQHMEEHIENTITFKDVAEKYPKVFSFCVQVSTLVTASSWRNYPSEGPFTSTGCLSCPSGHNQTNENVGEVSSITTMFCFHGL